MDRSLFAITLYCQDLTKSKDFYKNILELPIVFEDGNSCVFQLGSQMINLIPMASAPELVEPMPIAEPGAGSSFLLTIQVAEVDELATSMKARGARILNGPMDRAWGIRTLTISDPSGYAWEFSAPLNQAKDK